MMSNGSCFKVMVDMLSYYTCNRRTNTIPDAFKATMTSVINKSDSNIHDMHDLRDFLNEDKGINALIIFMLNHGCEGYNIFSSKMNEIAESLDIVLK